MPVRHYQTGTKIVVDGRRIVAFHLRAVSRIVGLTPDVVRDAVLAGVLPAPTFRYRARVYYSEGQLEAFRVFAAVWHDRQTYPTKEALAKELGTFAPNLDDHQRAGHIPRPSIAIGRRKHRYTPEEAAQVRDFYHRLQSARKRLVRLTPYLKSIGAKPSEIVAIARKPPPPACVVGHPSQGRYYRKADLRRALEALRRERR